jgi:hypothetical protein
MLTALHRATGEERNRLKEEGRRRMFTAENERKTEM